MVEELKTLKELNIPMKDINGDVVLELVYTSALRQEAIKWIKGLDEKRTEYLDVERGEHRDFFGLDMQVDWEESTEQDGVIKWIKHFFNITESEITDA